MDVIERPLVEGRVLDAGSGVEGLTVRLLLRLLRGEQGLGETRSGEDGSYAIEYDVAPLAGLRPGSLELVVQALRDPDGEVLGEAGAFVRAGEAATVDVVLVSPASSEWERLSERIMPLLEQEGDGTGGIHPWQLEPGDADRLAAASGLENEPVRLWVAAARAAHDERAVGLEPVVLYGLLRQGEPGQLDALLTRPTDELRAALDGAVAQGHIPALSPEKAAQTRDALYRRQLEEILRPRGETETAGLGDLVDSLPDALVFSPDERTSLARVALAQPDRGPEFWAAVEALPLRGPQVAALRSTVAADELARGDQALVRALQRHLPEAPDGTLAHLAELTPNQWIEVAAEARPDAALADIEREAALLAQAIELRYPSITFKSRLAAGAPAGYPAAEVAQFLDRHRDFDLRATDVEPFLIERGLDGDEALKGGVLRTQRVLRLGATQDEAMLLLAAGLTSAHGLVATGWPALTATLGHAIPEARLAVLHGNARVTLSGILGVASIVAPAITGPSIAAIAGPAAAPAALTRFPSLGALFGDLSSCSCRHCSSVLSPAAYLVDLLRTLRRAGAGDQLRRRRPDIAQLELTCENTTTELPYVDLVLEVLENAVTFPLPAILLTAADVAALDAGGVPASVSAQAVLTVSSVDGGLSVLQTIDSPAGSSAPQTMTLGSGSRRWSARRWSERLGVSGPNPAALPPGGTIPPGIRPTVLQALRNDQVPPELVQLLAPEPRLPVLGQPTVMPQLFVYDPDLADSEAWNIHIVRQVAVRLTPTGGNVGLLAFEQLNGTPIDTLALSPWHLILSLDAELAAGSVPLYLANLLPPLAYQVQREPGGPRWLLTARADYSVRYDPDRLVIDGLAFASSAASGDLTVVPENRNPSAYTALTAAEYPWSLPYDVFLDEVRACLGVMGTSRLELQRALRPALRNRTVQDTAEILQTTAPQLDRITRSNPTAAQRAACWGLAPTGNALADPSGDTAAPPIPGDWVGALRRLSVLLQRTALEVPSLLGAVSSRYVTGGGAAPTLDLAFECRPSRVTVQDLDGDRLERLHRLLRLRRITGWSLRDLDTMIVAVTDGLTRPLVEDQVTALAGMRELATRLGEPLRVVASWIGELETAPFRDREAQDALLPSLYEETFLRRQSGRALDGDLALDPAGAELAYITAQRAAGVNPPVLRTLTGKLPELGRALQARPADLRALVAAMPDELTLVNLAQLLRHVSLARALALTVPQYRLLASLADVPLFPAASAAGPDERVRRLLAFCDLVDDVRGSGFSFDELAVSLAQPSPDAAAEQARALDRRRWLLELQAQLERIPAVPAGDASEADVRAALASAGWPAACVDRVVAGRDGALGLTTALDVRVTVAGAAVPVIPATLPFAAAAALGGGFDLRVRVAELAGTDADAAFTALAGIAGLGPLTDASAPAARLRARWSAVEQGIARLATWLQSLVLPVFRTSLSTTVPAEALAPTAGRMRFDAGRGELVLTGYVDPDELTTFQGLRSGPQFASAVQDLVTQADAYVERVPANRLMTAAQVRAAVTADSAQAHLAAVVQAARVPLRRRVVAAAAAMRVGVDEALFSALDTAAQLASPPTDVLAPLSSDGFVAADLRGRPIAAAWTAAIVEVDRVGLVLGHLRARAAELAWYDASGDGFAGAAGQGFARPAGETSAARFAAWRRTVVLYRLRSTLPAQGATLEALRGAAAATGAIVDGALAVVEQAFELTDAVAALRLDGRMTAATDLLDPLLLRQVVDAARALRRLGAPATTSASLCAATLSETEARAARGLFAAKYGPRTASDGLRAAMDRLRERQRTALVQYLVQRDGAVDAADLHARYLLDVEMGAEMRTSRVRQAISSTQLFVQRWLMNLETGVPAADEELARAWEWIRTYRVWEANRKVFLYAERWLDPNLRDDKTHLFRRFESSLLQSEVTSERAVEALRGYLDGLQELSRVTVVAMCRETHGPRAGTVHLVGRTTHHPVQYFYRQWHPSGAAGSWDPWQPLDVLGDTDHTVVFIRNGRPHVAWLQIDDADSQDRRQATTDAAEVADSSTVWALQLQWSRLGRDGWSAPKKSPNKITHIKPINKEARTTFALRLEASGASGPVIRCYGGTTGASPVRPDPVPWPSTPEVTWVPLPQGTQVSTTQLIDVQVLGQVGSRYLPLQDAVIELWAYNSYVLGFSQFVYGTATSAWRIPNHDGLGVTAIFVPLLLAAIGGDVTVNIRVRFSGAADKTASVQINPMRQNTVRFGFVFPVSAASTGSAGAAIDPRRRLRLFPLATADWGLGESLRWQRDDRRQPTDELQPEGQAEHDYSGFRYPANAPIEIQGRTLANPAAAEPVFLSACASDDRPGLGLPYYLETESAAASGFVTTAMNGGLTFIPATEIAHVVVERALETDGDTVALPPGPTDAASAASVNRLALAGSISAPYDRAAPQFDRALPCSVYDWEVFFHAPLMVASALATHGRYAEALRWLHVVFDPTRTDGNAAPARWWRFPPFAAASRGVGIDMLLEDFSAGRLDAEQEAAIHAQIEFSRQSPFRPHGIARMRIRAYQWMAVLQYLDVLIGWGDQLFRRDTMESINEATQLYLLAGELLGRRPARMPERPRLLGPPTFALLADEWDDFANAYVSMADTPFFKAWMAWLQWLREHGIVGPGTEAYDQQVEQLKTLASIGSLTFCVPRNERIDAYFDTVADRLAKIRHGQNIDGVRRRLALFDPPIDPALLVRAVAAGLDIDSVLNETFAPQAPYRFGVTLQRAADFCTEVKALGAGLLSAVEKHDAEALARLRSTQELALQQLVGDSRRRQLDEANANVTALRQNRAGAEVRYRHYQRLLGKQQLEVPQENATVSLEAPRLRLASSTSDQVDAAVRGYGLTLEEADNLNWMGVANTQTLVGGAFQIAAGISNMVPNWSFPVGPTGISVSFGGSNVGAGLSAIGQFCSMLASNAAFQANRSSTIAAHQRRYDDHVLQSNLAAEELQQIDRQVAAAEIRADIAQREIDQHDRQREDLQAVDDLMRSKFSSQELYQWMVDRLADAHRTAYQAAYDLARQAERAFGFELGVEDPGVMRFGSWEGLRRGLLAGERLSVDLKRLESLYLERNRRELEITKHVSLNDIDPLALLRLQTTGSCEFAIPELLYDLDFPGHYFRRLRTVAVSVPAVVGPYGTVAGTLTLLENRLRASAAVTEDEESALRMDLVPVQSVATSSGREDAGVFELNFRDDRYLPFEGAGAISRWRFELPSAFRSFDYGTISDVVLHLRYTARDGGPTLRDDASRRVRAAMAAQRQELEEAGDEDRLVRAFSLRHDFSTEWRRLRGGAGTAQTIDIGIDRFPYVVRDQQLALWRVGVYVRGAGVQAGGDAPVTLDAPEAAYLGPDPQPSLELAPIAMSDGAGLYAADLEDGDWTPVMLDTDTGSAWRISLAAPGVELADLVIGFWWRLT